MNPLVADLTARISQPVIAPAKITGRVLRYDGLIVETSGFPATPGSLCEIRSETGEPVTGEIIGFNEGRNLVFLDRPGAAIIAGAPVHLREGGRMINVGEALLGRVIDAEGEPLDNRPCPSAPTNGRWRANR